MTPGLGHRRMLHQRALDLERADQVAGRLDHVVGAADEPEVAVGIAPARGRRSDTSRRRSTFGSAPPRAGSRGTSTASRAAAPARPPSSGSSTDLDARPSVLRRTIAASMPGSGRPIDPGWMSIAAKLAIMMPPVSVCHQLSWIGRPSASCAPDHRLRVERLADTGDEAQRPRSYARRVGAGLASACGSRSAPCTRR